MCEQQRMERMKKLISADMDGLFIRDSEPEQWRVTELQ